jgi:hypothetical protein
MSEGQRNDGVISERLLRIQVIAMGVAFVSLVVAVNWLPEGSAPILAATTLTLFVLVQVAVLIALVETAYGLFDKKGPRQRRAL